jgi:hypothetical protein
MRGLRPKLDWIWFFEWPNVSRKKAIMVHAAFSLSCPNCGMSTLRALALLFCLLGAVAPGGGARADGLRIGGLRIGGALLNLPRLVAPRFAGPRYDGPAAADLAAPVPPDARVVLPAGPPPGPSKCYSAAETRERVASQKLRPAFEMMLKASSLTGAEVMAGKLCRWGNDDIYVISLLRHDGALVRVFMNAVTGRVVGARNLH